MERKWISISLLTSTGLSTRWPRWCSRQTDTQL